MKYNFLIFLLFIVFINIGTKDIVEDQDTIKKGNFALSSSQQPGPLFGFGQNIIDKNDLQTYIYTDYIKNKMGRSTNIMPGLLYGIQNNLAAFLNIPISIIQKSIKAGGSLQLEYAYFSKSKPKSALQATILAALSGPNGSMIKQVTSNKQSSTFFLGGTFNYMSINWYLYSSLGELFSIPRKSKTQPGDNFLYQLGLGLNLHNSENYVYLLLTEILGSKFKSHFINQKIDTNSGGNILFIAPSIWISSNRFILQLGSALPVYHQLIGTQNKYGYQIAINLGWKF